MKRMNAIEIAIKYAIESEHRKLLALALEENSLEKVIEYLKQCINN